MKKIQFVLLYTRTELNATIYLSEIFREIISSDNIMPELREFEKMLVDVNLCLYADKVLYRHNIMMNLTFICIPVCRLLVRFKQNYNCDTVAGQFGTR